MTLIKKSRESTTLQMLIPMLAIVLFKFAFAGLTIKGYVFPAMTAGEFAAAEALLLAIWLGREWRSAKFKNDPPTDV